MLAKAHTRHSAVGSRKRFFI